MTVSDQVNAAMMSINDFFQKHKNLTTPKLLNSNVHKVNLDLILTLTGI